MYRQKTSIRTKILGWLSAILIVVGFSLAIYYWWQQKDMLLTSSQQLSNNWPAIVAVMVGWVCNIGYQISKSKD